MSHFSTLIDEVADQQSHALSDVLMKAKVLASRLRSRKFRQWVDSEINGYPQGQTLPEYRIVGATIEGFYGGYGGDVLPNVPISITHLEDDMRPVFESNKMLNGIAYIEDLASGEGDIGMWMDGQIVNFLRRYGTRVSNMILNRVFKRVSKQSLVALLASVRARLLDFLLELRDRYPELETADGTMNDISPREIDEAFERRIYQQCTVFEGFEMRDSYQAGQVGAMGPGAHAEQMNFVQILRDAIGESSLAELATDLEQLRMAMLTEAKSADQDTAVNSVAEAEAAAKMGDARSVLGHLKSAGKWAMDVATKLGTTLAVKALEKSFEL